MTNCSSDAEPGLGAFSLPAPGARARALVCTHAHTRTFPLARRVCLSSGFRKPSKMLWSLKTVMKGLRNPAPWGWRMAVCSRQTAPQAPAHQGEKRVQQRKHHHLQGPVSREGRRRLWEVAVQRTPGGIFLRVLFRVAGGRL